MFLNFEYYQAFLTLQLQTRTKKNNKKVVRISKGSKYHYEDEGRYNTGVEQRNQFLM